MKSFLVELVRTGVTVSVNEDESILDVIRDAGVEVVSSCEQGVCGTCETTVLEGFPDHQDSLLSPQEQQENKTMMICCSGSKSARLVLDL